MIHMHLEKLLHFDGSKVARPVLDVEAQSHKFRNICKENVRVYPWDFDIATHHPLTQ